MRDAFRKARRFLMSVKGLSEDEAIALISVAVDFGITQVVNGNWGGARDHPQVAVRGRMTHPAAPPSPNFELAARIML